MDRIIVVRDNTGRKWTYEYDDYGDLVIVTSPSTDRYPLGLSTSYEYSSDAYSPPLQHNLLRIIDPAGSSTLKTTTEVTPVFLTSTRHKAASGQQRVFFAYQVVVDDFEFTTTIRETGDSGRPNVANGQMVISSTTGLATCCCARNTCCRAASRIWCNGDTATTETGRC